MLPALLALDVGNTHTDAAWFHGGRLQLRSRWLTDPRATADDVTASVRGAMGRVPPETPILLSSVVLALSAVYRRAWPQTTLVTAASPLNFRLAVPSPAQIGTDRLAACVAAVAQFGAPVVVVDCGTAATLSVIDAQGRFLGGTIMPGLRSGLRGLLAAAPRLPDPDLSRPLAPLGTTTADAVRLGTVRGHAGALREVIGLAQGIVGDAPVVGTGGALPLVSDWIPELTAVEPDLVLRGLYEIGCLSARQA